MQQLPLLSPPLVELMGAVKLQLDRIRLLALRMDVGQLATLYARLESVAISSVQSKRGHRAESWQTAVEKEREEVVKMLRDLWDKRGA